MSPVAGGPRRLTGRAGAVAAAALLLGISGGAAWLGGSPSGDGAGEPEPASTLAIRDESRPKLADDPGDLQLMGDETSPSTDQLCNEERMARMQAAIEGVAEDGVFVDERSWRETAWGGRSGLASFWSKCLQAGGAVHIRSGGDGALLAVYDPATGLTTP